MVCKLQARFESNTFLFFFSCFFSSSQLILSYSLIKKRDVFYLYGDVIQTIMLDEKFTGLRNLVVYLYGLYTF